MAEFMDTDSKRRKIIIIPCGAKKRIGRWEAGKLYAGPYFAACLRYALARSSPQDIFILSAKYGLLALHDEVDSYDVKIGGSGSITAQEVKQQARDFDLLLCAVTAIGGRAYTGICRAVWPKCQTPLEGVGGIGKQLRWLKIYQHD